MSGSVLPFGATNYGMMGDLVANMTATRERLSTLTAQASSGDIAETYAGLGSGAPVSLDLNPEIASIATWQANINAAEGSMQVAQAALSEISQIATNFNASLNTLNDADPASIATTAAAARQALVEVANLLDTTNGSNYVFAGQDSVDPPVPNASAILSSGFFSQITAAVAGLPTGGASATIANVLSIGASNVAGTSPFSAALSRPAAALAGVRPLVQVGQGQFVAVGIIASANAYVPSSGPDSTGSYMRDVMTGLAAIGALSSPDAGLSDFQGFLGGVRNMLSGAVTALNQDAGALGDQQSALTSESATLSATSDALKTQVGSVQDADMAATATQLSLVQTQLQASYQVISQLGSLSLVNYL